MLVTTQCHLMHVYDERHPKVDVVMSLTDTMKRASHSIMEESDLPMVPVIVKSLADRVIFASQSLNGAVKFMSRQMLMLEPILLGYLSATPIGKADVSSV